LSQELNHGLGVHSKTLIKRRAIRLVTAGFNDERRQAAAQREEGRSKKRSAFVSQLERMHLDQSKEDYRGLLDRMKLSKEVRAEPLTGAVE
jgi:hypothetical protein